MRLRRPALIATAYIAFGVAVFAARPPATPGPMARDFEAYWSAGATFDRHADAYTSSIWNDERTVPGVNAGREGPLPFVAPPAMLPFWGVIAHVPYAVAAPWWLLFLCSALGGLLLACLRGARVHLTAANGFAAIALAITFGPITSDLALGQFAVVAAFGASLLVVAARMLPATLGAVLALAQPNVVPALLSQVSRKRQLIAMAVALGVIYLIGAFAAGWNWVGVYVALLAAHGAAERFTAIQITPGAIAYGLGATPAAALFIAIAVALAAVALAVAIAKRTPDAFARFAAFAALTPFVSGFWHEHDLVMAFPAAMWCALRCAPSRRAIALIGTLLVAIDWFGFAQRPGAIAQTALLAIAAWCAFNALRSSTLDLPVGYASAAVAALFVAAAVLAVADPAPVWPNAMHAIGLPPNAPIAQEWSAQQEATGLDRPVATWALLRALSLAGCALLAYATGSRSAYYRTA